MCVDKSTTWGGICVDRIWRDCWLFKRNGGDVIEGLEVFGVGGEDSGDLMAEHGSG